MDPAAAAAQIEKFILMNSAVIGYILGLLFIYILAYNIRDMVRNAFIGICVRISKNWEEHDVITIRPDTFKIRKFGFFRVFGYLVEDGKVNEEKDYTIPYLKFSDSVIIRIHKGR